MKTGGLTSRMYLYTKIKVVGILKKKSSDETPEQVWASFFKSL